MVVLDEGETGGGCEVVAFVTRQPMAPADVRDRGLDDRLILDVGIDWGQDGAILLGKIRPRPTPAAFYLRTSFALCSGVRIASTAALVFSCAASRSACAALRIVLSWAF